MALTLGFGYAAAMISAKIFPYQVESLGFHGTMWAHAAISAVMTLGGNSIEFFLASVLV